MHVYAYPANTSSLIQYSGAPYNSFAVGPISWVSDQTGDAGTIHTFGVITFFPGYSSRDAMIAKVRDAVKTAVNSTYSITLTDDQLTVVGL